MDHPITIGGLLLSVGAFIGLACVGIGLLMLAAASMSDAGDDGTGSTGCATAAIGALLLASCLFWLLR